MNRGVTWRLVLCLTAMLSSVSLARADYETGQTAWQAGRHAEALAQWREAAQTGDGKAMLALGRAFARGLGVPQDYVLAHMWLNLAAGRGERRGGERAGYTGREHDSAAHSIGAGARPGMAIGTRGRRAESRRGSARRRTDCGGGPAAAASDPRGSRSHGRARLRSGLSRRALGSPDREGLYDVPSRRGPAAGERVDPGRPALHARRR